MCALPILPSGMRTRGRTRRAGDRSSGHDGHCVLDQHLRVVAIRFCQAVRGRSRLVAPRFVLGVGPFFDQRRPGNLGHQHRPLRAGRLAAGGGNGRVPGLWTVLVPQASGGSTVGSVRIRGHDCGYTGRDTPHIPSIFIPRILNPASTRSNTHNKLATGPASRHTLDRLGRSGIRTQVVFSDGRRRFASSISPVEDEQCETQKEHRRNDRRSAPQDDSADDLDDDERR